MCDKNKDKHTIIIDFKMARQLMKLHGQTKEQVADDMAHLMFNEIRNMIIKNV